jgi:hypothetical protein
VAMLHMSNTMSHTFAECQMKNDLKVKKAQSIGTKRCLSCVRAVICVNSYEHVSSLRIFVPCIA